MARNRFVPETATQEADLPHAYSSPDGSRNHPCDVCQVAYTDPRHLAWEQAMAHRESASAVTMPRETGS